MWETVKEFWWDLVLKYDRAKIGIGNIKAYWWLIWEDRDYDYVYLLKLMEFKLRRMDTNMEDFVSKYRKKSLGSKPLTEESRAALQEAATLCQQLQNYDLFGYMDEVPNFSELTEAQRRKLWKDSQKREAVMTKRLAQILADNLLIWWM